MMSSPRVRCLVASLLVLAACSADEESGQSAAQGDRPTQVTAAAQPSDTDEVADRILSLGQRGLVVSPDDQAYQLANGLAPLADAPLFIGDYADPFVLALGPELYLYTTNTVDQNVPVLTSEAGAVATPSGDALPELPSWTEPGLVWAPSVLATDDGFVLYYTSVDRATGLQCVGAAVADSPLGPFVDDHEGPFVCQRDLGGTIDASPFVAEDGTPWLLYKNDGNCCDINARLWIQQLSEDGTGFVAGPVELLATTEEWEGPLIEGPSMTQLGESHWLFYSANDWNSADYATGIARCDAPSGPCTKLDDPWITNHGDAVGPGGAEVFADARGRRWIVYHAWTTDAVGYEAGGARSLFAVPLDESDGVPVARGLSEPSEPGR